MAELWDVYDGNKQVTKKVIERNQRDQLGDDEFHLVVCILIINSSKDIMIQKRSPNKSGWPNIWADTGGAALKGETSKEAILRELYEELGIQLKPEDVHLLISQKITNEINYFRDVYIAHQDYDISLCRLDYDEVVDVRWATIQEIEELIAMDEFLNLQESYIPYLKKYLKSLTI